jgi:hypothetical protein
MEGEKVNQIPKMLVHLGACEFHPVRGKSCHHLISKEFADMNLKTGTVIWIFIWSIFMGITAGSIGIGAAFPPANYVAKPFVCPGGQMQLTTQNYQPSPVESVTTLTWYCVDGTTGAKSELGIFPMSLYAGAIYGVLLFLIIILVMVILTNRRAAQT